MRLLTERAIIVCEHLIGRVGLEPVQDLVRIAGDRVLVRPDPEGRPVRGCPNISPVMKPCLRTFPVQGGYSDLVRVEGRAVCLDTVWGLTDGTPPGLVRYKVREPGQDLVTELG